MPLSSENMQFQIKKNMMDGSGGNATAATLSMQEKRQQIHDILSAYDNQASILKSNQPNKQPMSLSKGASSTQEMVKRANSTDPNLKGSLSEITSAKYNALLKLPPQKSNTSTFKAVPREYVVKK